LATRTLSHPQGRTDHNDNDLSKPAVNLVRRLQGLPSGATYVIILSKRKSPPLWEWAISFEAQTERVSE
jgi:hypothetical protein